MLRIAIHAPQHPVIAFAVEELRHFLAPVATFTEADADVHIHLQIDPSLPAYAFAVDCATPSQIILRGHDATCVLHSTYTLLEKLGYRFEITGTRLIHNTNLEAAFAALIGWSQQVQPAVNRRGIRQHLNFPMDISSYPLDEALDYIRNLVRLRFNHITFHSYLGQWYEVHYPGAEQLAGEYFYGQRHDLPDHPVLRRVIRNQNTFCIPEHEALIDDPAANSRAAIAWLQAVMNEAHRVGLHIQFSIELREMILGLSLATVDSVLATYPHIETLELITEETGMWASSIPAAELQEVARRAFGDDALTDPAIASQLVDGQRDLDKIIVQMAHNLEVIKTLQASGRALPVLALGVYCTVPSDHKLILAVLQRYVPQGVSCALLFDHGNRAVADNLRDLAMPRADWARTLVYSWIEFDGTVYLFQNALTGIDQLMRLATTAMGDAPVSGIALNHWRTAENRTTARYSAETLLNGVLDRATFYQSYAASLGIAHAEGYAEAMNLLDDADTQARYELPNVGFSFVGCWGSEGLGYYGIFKHDRAIAVRDKYAAAVDRLRASLAATANPDGRSYLAFLVNRAHATVIYLQAIADATALQPLCDGKTPDQLTTDEQAEVRRICDGALALMEDYMALHADAIVDRGSEGTLISFYVTPPAVLKRIRTEYGSGQVLAAPTAETFDAPPSPIALEEIEAAEGEAR